MTPQEMFIKLKGYFGHNLPCEFHHHKRVEHKTLEEYPLNYGLLNLGIKKIVPKLRPLESMTAEKDFELLEFLDDYFGQIQSPEATIDSIKDNFKYLPCFVIERLMKEHFDIFNLIGQGLAVEKEEE